MVLISAFTIETEPRGFARSSWPALALAQAIEGAKALSEQAASCARYPNAFWVLEGAKPVCKFYRGRRYAPGESI